MMKLLKWLKRAIKLVWSKKNVSLNKEILIHKTNKKFTITYFKDLLMTEISSEKRGGYTLGMYKLQILGKKFLSWGLYAEIYGIKHMF